jgi:glycosyltransferase involved in cell wall biosynthesis
MVTLPSVAVIIPCYNAEKWVAQAIRSALDQDYPNLEVIVIDDGSTDGSLDIIRSFGDRIRWETGPNRGACAARNRGLALTEAEYVMFLDADDWLVPGSVAGQVSQALRLDPAASGITFGDFITTDEFGRTSEPSPKPWLTDGGLASKAWLLLVGPGTTAPLHRRRYVLAVGGFGEGLEAGQEYDLHVRLMRAGISFYYHDAPIYYRREHGSIYRISNKPRGPDFRYWSGVYLDLLREGEMNDRERDLVAKSAWARGRTHLRHGVRGSDFFFGVAKTMSPRNCMTGSAAYRILCRLAGPIGAERASLLFHRFKRLLGGRRNKAAAPIGGRSR